MVSLKVKQKLQQLQDNNSTAYFVSFLPDPSVDGATTVTVKMSQADHDALVVGTVYDLAFDAQ